MCREYFSQKALYDCFINTWLCGRDFIIRHVYHHIVIPHIDRLLCEGYYKDSKTMQQKLKSLRQFQFKQCQYYRIISENNLTSFLVNKHIKTIVMLCRNCLDVFVNTLVVCFLSFKYFSRQIWIGLSKLQLAFEMCKPKTSLPPLLFILPRI